MFKMNALSYVHTAFDNAGSSSPFQWKVYANSHFTLPRSKLLQFGVASQVSKTIFGLYMHKTHGHLMRIAS